MEEVDYKKKLEDLIQDINSIIIAQPLKFKGCFEIKNEVHEQIGEKGYLNIICTKIVYKDISDLDILYIESYDNGTPAVTIWENFPVSPYIVKNHYKTVYTDFFNYLLFAVDNRDLKDGRGIIMVTIPIRTLLKDGYGRK